MHRRRDPATGPGTHRCAPRPPQAGCASPAVVAQLVRAPACRAGCREFEPRRRRPLAPDRGESCRRGRIGEGTGLRTRRLLVRVQPSTPRGRRPTARTSARHAEDARSTRADHTTLLDAQNEGSFASNADDPDGSPAFVRQVLEQDRRRDRTPSECHAVTEVEVDDTPGCGPGGSRFESGRSPHRIIHRGRSGIRGASCAPPGGFDSHPATRADVAQLGEARRSDRRECRFESDRQYHHDRRRHPGVTQHQLDVAQRERTGIGGRGLSVRTRPSKTDARWWNRNHTGLWTRRTAFESWPRSHPPDDAPAVRTLRQRDRPAAQAGDPSDPEVASSSLAVASVT
jgi:hypothetical protein